MPTSNVQLGYLLTWWFILSMVVYLYPWWLHVIELNDNNLVHNAYSEINRDTGFSHKTKLFLGKINFSHVWVN